MKRFLLVAICFSVSMQVLAQTHPYNVVFDLTTDDTATYSRVIRWINGIVGAYPDAKIEVVFYGKSLPMVETRLSNVGDAVKKLAAGRNTTFVVCEQSMQHHHVDKTMLISGVKTVPDAIYELVSRQADGFGYIKITN